MPVKAWKSSAIGTGTAWQRKFAMGFKVATISLKQGRSP